MTARITPIDGLRGWFIVFMVNTHMDFRGGHLLQELDLKTVSFVNAAFGFVLVSGLMAGMVFGALMLRSGFAVAAGRIWRRTGEVYLYSVGLVAVLVLAAVSIPGAHGWWETWLGPLSRPTGLTLALAAALLQQPLYANILSMYVLFLGLTPFVLGRLIKGQTAPVLAVSFLVWLVAQFGVFDAPVAAINNALNGLQSGLHLQDAFDYAAWQLIFVIGLSIGAQMARGQSVPILDTPLSDKLAVGSLIAMIAIALVRVGERGYAALADSSRLFVMSDIKRDFAWIAAANLIFLLVYVAWVMVCGYRSQNLVLRKSSKAVLFALNLEPLRLIGRHSLQVYALHVLLIYAVEALQFEAGELPALAKSALLIVSLLTLYIFAVWLDRKKAAGKARARAASAGQSPSPVDASSSSPSRAA